MPVLYLLKMMQACCCFASNFRWPVSSLDQLRAYKSKLEALGQLIVKVDFIFATAVAGINGPNSKRSDEGAQDHAIFSRTQWLSRLSSGDVATAVIAVAHAETVLVLIPLLSAQLDSALLWASQLAHAYNYGSQGSGHLTFNPFFTYFCKWFDFCYFGLIGYFEGFGLCPKLEFESFQVFQNPRMVNKG